LKGAEGGGHKRKRGKDGDIDGEKRDEFGGEKREEEFGEKKEHGEGGGRRADIV